MKPQDIENMDVAVVGGGYAGVTAGLALGQIGANVKVYEQAKAIREVGAGIGLRPVSMSLFRRLGVREDLLAVTSPSDYFEIHDARGNLLKREEWPSGDVDDEDHKTRMIHRGDFIDALVKHLSADDLVLAHRCTAVIDNGNNATVCFSNGNEVTADLVVGADGIRSDVRRLFSDNEPVAAHAHAYRVVIDGDKAEGLLTDDNLHLYLDDETGNMIYFLPLRHRNQVSFDITVLSDDTSWNPQVGREQILASLRNFDPRLIRMVERMDMSRVNFRSAYDIDPVDTWHSDSVVLIGDAAHAMLHHQGQGANSAVLDAGALADALVEADDVPAALNRYTEQRQGVTQELQRISRESWDRNSACDTAFPGQK